MPERTRRARGRSDLSDLGIPQARLRTAMGALPSGDVPADADDQLRRRRSHVSRANRRSSQHPARGLWQHGGRGPRAGLRANGAFSLANEISYGATTLYAGYTRADLTLDGYPQKLFDRDRQSGPPDQAIAERYDMDDKRYEVVTLGGRYDPGDWFLMGEWARTESRAFFANSRGTPRRAIALGR